MEALVVLLVLIAGLALLDAAAVAWGAESRDSGVRNPDLLQPGI